MSTGSGSLGPDPDASGNAAVRRALRWYLLWSLVALVVVGVGVVLISNLIARNEALRDSERQARAIADSIVKPLANQAFHDRDPGAMAAMAEALAIRAQDGSLLHVKLWENAGGGNGRILYSDEPSLVGKTFELEEDEYPVFGTRNVVTSISTLNKAENSLEKSAGELVEVYAGVNDVAGTEMLFEGYIATNALHEDSRLLRGELVPLTLGALLLLFLASLPLAISLARRVDRSQADRRRLLNNAVASSDLERRRIARDLHDGVIQDLAGVGYSLSSMSRQIPQDTDLKGQLDEANGIVRRDVASLRTLMTDIYPPDLDDRGLALAVRELLAQSSMDPYVVSLEVDEPLTPSPTTARLTFRVVRESLRNVVKHSQATHVTVRLRQQDGWLMYEVEDDGVGFDENQAAREGHLGLRLVQETVADAGGELAVNSSPGAGTHVLGSLPL
jgi:two-component system NarL family sensor kinase